MGRFHVLLGGLIYIIILKHFSGCLADSVKYGIFIIIIIINTYPFFLHTSPTHKHKLFPWCGSLSFLPPCHCSCYPAPWKPCLPPTNPSRASESCDISGLTEPKTTTLDHWSSSFLSHISQTPFKILCQWPTFYLDRSDLWVWLSIFKKYQGQRSVFKCPECATNKTPDSRKLHSSNGAGSPADTYWRKEMDGGDNLN